MLPSCLNFCLLFFLCFFGVFFLGFGYLKGFVVCFFYRLLQVFPNSDPLIGFIVPAAKNESFWKPLFFAFFSMFLFDFFTSGVGVWTFVTSFTYVFVVFLLRFLLSGQDSSLGLFVSRGVFGILFFDFVTGPLMSTWLFRQDFFVTVLLQVPFTVMHLFSGAFFIILVSPFFDARVSAEFSFIVSSVKARLVSFLRSFI